MTVPKDREYTFCVYASSSGEEKVFCELKLCSEVFVFSVFQFFLAARAGSRDVLSFM